MKSWTVSTSLHCKIGVSLLEGEAYRQEGVPLRRDLRGDNKEGYSHRPKDIQMNGK